MSYYKQQQAKNLKGYNSIVFSIEGKPRREYLYQTIAFLSVGAFGAIIIYFG